MIKANELRIGNWYMSTAKSKPMQATGNMIAFCSDKKLELLPIPLTSEILEKAGFKNKKDKVSIFDKDWLRIYLGIKESLAYLIDEDSNDNAYYIPVTVSSLHQLQNLYFSLTGEELEIKL